MVDEEEKDTPDNTTQCPNDFAACLTENQCVHGSWLCDGEADCKDQSDETDKSCSQPDCDPGWWMCDDGQCIEGKFVCNKHDYHPDFLVCEDLSHESIDCTQWSCSEGYIKCDDELQCIEVAQICDVHLDCDDESVSFPLCVPYKFSSMPFIFEA